MKVIVTGAASGIGDAIVSRMLQDGHIVYGIDLIRSDRAADSYIGYLGDVTDKASLPDIAGAEVLINCAGTQHDPDAINTNLLGVINCTEMYGLQDKIRAIVNIASVSAHNGAEFPRYVASKGGVLAYTKYTAIQVAKYGATCNSVSPGGVITMSNKHILEDAELYKAVLNETLLGKWASPFEVADLVYFLAICSRSITGQDIIIDNGETSKANFVW